jgi:hypothetical protein
VAITARMTAAWSKPLRRTGFAPSWDNHGKFSGDRVVATTWWWEARRSGTNRFPIAPVAPATKIFMDSFLSDVSRSAKNLQTRIF